MSTNSNDSPRSLLTRLRNLLTRFSARGTAIGESRSKLPPASLRLTTTAFSNFPDFVAYYKSMESTFAVQLERELAMITDDVSFTTPGYCYPCRKEVALKTDFLYSGEARINGRKIPNWRERLNCPDCGLCNRIRASVQFLEETLGCQPESALYISEQTTQLYDLLRSKYANLVGSEYLGDRVAFGAVEAVSGLRNESITKLSFADESFDFVLSFDVFEHIPEYEKALRECFRVLKPGGKLLFTVPFRLDSQTNLIRATRDEEGNVTHLMEPEYHGDPINTEGCLCFYHFGWQLLDELKQDGFSSAKAHLYWSDTLGYLGQHQVLFCAEKAFSPKL
jgi:SAM-dependent methyltransferase